jgi:hypothetical protein
MSGASLNLNVAGNVHSHSSGESTDMTRSRSPSPLRSSGDIVNDLAAHVDVVVIDMEQLFRMLELDASSSDDAVALGAPPVGAAALPHAVPPMAVLAGAPAGGAPGPAPAGAPPAAAHAGAPPAAAHAGAPPAVPPAGGAPGPAPMGGAPGPAPVGVPPAAAPVGVPPIPAAGGAGPAPVGGGGARALCARFLNDLFLEPPNCSRATAGWGIIVGGSIPFGMSVAAIAGVPSMTGSASEIAGSMAFGITVLLLGAVLLGLQYCRPAPPPPAPPHIPQAR